MKSTKAQAKNLKREGAESNRISLDAFRINDNSIMNRIVFL